MKRILATLLAVAVLMSLFTSVAMADSSISITADGVYSDDTLAGTKLHITSECTLGSGQTIAYYLNGNKVGEATEEGNFAFTSVPGENKLTAKILNGNDVVAVSNELTYNFKTLVQATNFGTDAFDAVPASSYYQTPSTGMELVQEDSNNVLKVSLTQDYIKNLTGDYQFAFPKDGSMMRDKCTDGYIKFGYDIKISKPAAGIRFFQLKGKYDSSLNLNEYTSYNFKDNKDFVDGITTHVAVQGSTTASRGNDGFTLNEWHRIQMIADMNTRTVDTYIDNEQILSDVPMYDDLTNPDYIIFAKVFKNVEAASDLEFYLDNMSLEKMVTPSATLSAPESALAGKKVALNAKVSGYDDCRYIYNINGVDSEITSSATYLAEVVSGENTAYVKAVDSNGNIVAASDVVRYAGIYRDFTAHRTYTGLSTDSSVLSQYAGTGGEVGKVDLSQSADAEDAAHGTVYRFYMKDVHWQSVEFTESKLDTSANTLGSVSGQDTISLSWDIKKIKMDSIPQNDYMGLVSYKDSTGAVKTFVPFIFSGDETLYIATEFKSVNKKNKGIEIPAPNGKWYNFSVIADDVTDMIYLSVNDVIYSSFAFDATEGTTFSMTNSLSNFYIDRFNICRGGSDVNKGEREIYFDNLQWSYAKAPSVLTTPVFTNNGLKIDEKADINYTSPLNIEFNAINEGTDVMCIASILSTSGGHSELVSVDAASISFKPSDYAKPVNLSLTNLPNDIATGNYTIRIMIWNGTNLAPVCDVIPFS